MELKHSIRTELPMGSCHIDNRCRHHRGILAKKKELRTIIVSCNVVLSSSEYFRYNPHFLLRFTSGLLACSILITSLLAACRYMTLEGILIKAICHVDLSSCPAAQKILLDQHTCTCYNRTLHMLKLLKLHFC